MENQASLLPVDAVAARPLSYAIAKPEAIVTDFLSSQGIYHGDPGLFVEAAAPYCQITILCINVPHFGRAAGLLPETKTTIPSFNTLSLRPLAKRITRIKAKG